MKNLLNVAVIGLFAMTLLVGCGKSEHVKKAEEFADKACKCEDAKCAQAVGKEFTEWTATIKNEKVFKSDAEKVKTATEKFTKCLTAAMLKGIGGAAKPAAAKPAAAKPAAAKPAPAAAKPAPAAAKPAPAPAAAKPAEAKPAEASK